MQTDRILVGNDGLGREDAFLQVEKFADYVGIGEKTALRLRLLTEEALSLVEEITGDFAARLWLESTSEGAAQIHLKARTRMDFFKKQELIRTATDHKNASAVGVMGKIRSVVEDCLYGMGSVYVPHQEWSGSPLIYGTVGLSDPDEMNAMQSTAAFWSLKLYRENVENAKEEDEAAEEAWDELERSIVANLADDVKVYVKGDEVELVIEKKL